ncbi:hypothetical protein [Ferriphaselus sp. R-1]|uniref:hypothetical protein n=1 Tax=Ferriphaselus sp. R-1 TaxID=1485544 RepID=UPI000551FE09|nr:hypothetical protein [Ferriphaselus sp. R-1]
MDHAVILNKSALGKSTLSLSNHALSRTERNLLLMADGQRTADELINMIAASNIDLLERLVADGYLEVTGLGTVADSQQIGKALGVPELDLPLTSLLQDTPFARLYAFLVVQIPHFFGLTTFINVLKLEQATNLADLEPLQQKLLDAVAKKRGSEAAAAYLKRMNDLLQQ